MAWHPHSFFTRDTPSQILHLFQRFKYLVPRVAGSLPVGPIFFLLKAIGVRLHVCNHAAQDASRPTRRRRFHICFQYSRNCHSTKVNDRSVTMEGEVKGKEYRSQLVFLENMEMQRRHFLEVRFRVTLGKAHDLTRNEGNCF